VTNLKPWCACLCSVLVTAFMLIHVPNTQKEHIIYLQHGAYNILIACAIVLNYSPWYNRRAWLSPNQYAPNLGCTAEQLLYGQFTRPFQCGHLYCKWPYAEGSGYARLTVSMFVTRGVRHSVKFHTPWPKSLKSNLKSRNQLHKEIMSLC